MSRSLQQLVAASAGKARLESLAKTREGRDVWLVTLGQPSRTQDEVGASAAASSSTRRPAILIVANLEADHLVGSQVALAMLSRIVRDPAWESRLAKVTLYVVPRLNPDGAERLFRKPFAQVRTNLTPLDRDRDGQSGEDGPDDLNGDGLITQMRVKDGKAALIPDAGDPRILKKADPAKGERPIYSEYLEGTDNDADGQINEDSPGGVNLNRNWSFRWSEFDPEAGYSPVAEPETRALVRFAFDHPEIALVWSFGLNDNLAVAPKKPETPIDAADLPIFTELSKLHGKTMTTILKGRSADGDHSPEPASAVAGDKPKANKAERDNTSGTPKAREHSTPAAATATAAPASSGATTDGALSEWAYHHYGVIGLASRLWPGPDLAALAGTEAGTQAPGAKPGPSSGPAAVPASRPAVPEDGEARWFYWNDQIMKGRAFLPFVPFDHPTLGKVELGGWRPGVRYNPPIEDVEPIARVNQSFLEELAKRLPRLAIRDVKVEARGRGIYQVTAAIVNEGELPTALVQGVRSGKAQPVRLRLDTGAGKLLAGPARSQFDSLGGSGGRREFRWLVLAPKPDDANPKPFALTLEVSSPKAGGAVQAIPIGQGK